MVESLGAEKVIDYTVEDFAQNGETYDIIFNTVGKLPFSRCKNSHKPKGVYLTTIPNLEIFPHLLWPEKRGGKKAKFMAAGLRSASAKIEGLLFLKELFEAGKINSVIDKCYLLEQLAEAHRYVERGHKRGNVVITVERHQKI